MFKILVVEDDVNTQKLICAILKRGGYNTLAAKDGLDALNRMERQYFDLIILDLMMPGMDGFQLCKELRDAGDNIPILMLTAQQEIKNKHRGFLAGTDDYMTKPFDEQEMLLRIKALLRRAQIVNEHKLTIGTTTLDYNTRRQLMDEIWGPATETDEHTLNVHMGRLREKFKDNPDFEIVTVRGLGYKAVKQT